MRPSAFSCCEASAASFGVGDSIQGLSIEVAVAVGVRFRACTDHTISIVGPTGAREFDHAARACFTLGAVSRVVPSFDTDDVPVIVGYSRGVVALPLRPLVAFPRMVYADANGAATRTGAQVSASAAPTRAS